MPKSTRQSALPAPVHARTNRVIRVVRWVRLLTHVAVGLAVVGAIFPRVSMPRRAGITKWWARKLLRILNILLSIHGARPATDTRKLIVAANHISWVDIFVVNATQPSRFIAKAEIRDWPIAGWLSEKAGTIFIRRTRRSDTAKINEIMHNALAGGATIGFFPEGTTTAGDKLLKFHTSLFEPAVVNAAVIAPAAIRYRTSDGAPSAAAAFIGELSFAESIAMIISEKSMIAEITFAPQIQAAGLTRRELALRSEAAIAAIMGVPLPHSHTRFDAKAGEGVLAVG